MYYIYNCTYARTQHGELRDYFQSVHYFDSWYYLVVTIYKLQLHTVTNAYISDNSMANYKITFINLPLFWGWESRSARPFFLDNKKSAPPFSYPGPPLGGAPSGNCTGTLATLPAQSQSQWLVLTLRDADCAWESVAWESVAGKQWNAAGNQARRHSALEASGSRLLMRRQSTSAVAPRGRHCILPRKWTAAWQVVSLAVWQPGSRTIWQPGNLAAWQPVSLAAWQPGNLTAW